MTQIADKPMHDRLADNLFGDTDYMERTDFWFSVFSREISAIRVRVWRRAVRFNLVWTKIRSGAFP